jgi:serine/threonine protein kinase
MEFEPVGARRVTTSFRILSNTVLYSVVTAVLKVSIRDRLRGAPLDAVELIEHMLQYNPASRPSARKCLSSVYFRNAPPPTPAASLPKSVKRNDSL